MKKTFLTFITSVALSASLWAQAPQAFNYQGVARDLSGTAMATKNISVKASILDGTATGTVVYAETQTIATNQFGLFTLSIGTGTVVSGIFANTNWASGNKYLKIEIDPNGGSSYTLTGTTQLLSVPYAMYSAKAGDSKWNDVTGGINYSGGKVGIGTSTPAAWLSIEKNVSGADRPLLTVDNISNLVDSYSGTGFSAGTGTNKNSLSIQVNSEGYFPALGTGGQSFITAKQLVLKSQPNTNASDGFVSIYTGGTYDGLNTGAERMRVTYDGKVGIGTTTPKAKLQVSSGDVYLDDATKGIIMKNTSGQCYRITVGTTGALVSTLITCP